jgi:transposase-like protein
MAASKHPTSKQGSGHRHPPELRERAVRMVEETMKETGERHGVLRRQLQAPGQLAATG